MALPLCLFHNEALHQRHGSVTTKALSAARSFRVISECLRLLACRALNDHEQLLQEQRMANLLASLNGLLRYPTNYWHLQIEGGIARDRIAMQPTLEVGFLSPGHC